MNIANLCQRELVSIDAGASLRDAAVLMREHHVGALVITSRTGDRPHVVGIVTDRDLTIEVLARELQPADLRVGQFASRKVVAVAGRASLQDAVATMEKAGVRRLLVVDDEGGATGLVSADDVIGALAAEFGGLARALRGGIERETAERTTVAPPRPRPLFAAYGTPGMPWPAMSPLQKG